jgi:hypothetical protein
MGNESLIFEDPMLIEDDQFGPVASLAIFILTAFPFGAWKPSPHGRFGLLMYF